VEPDSLRDYPDSKFWLKTKVFTLFSFMIMFFAIGFILEILLIYILAVRLFKGSA
jgi:hypothetical protein